jgi:hypothetical protein
MCHQHWASRFAVDRVALAVIQAPKLESRIMRYELTDYKWAAIKPFPDEQAACGGADDRYLRRARATSTEPVSRTTVTKIWVAREEA